MLDREEPASQVTERKEREELFYSEKKKMKKPKKAKKTKITKTTKTKTAKTKTCWLGLASQVTTKKKKLTAKGGSCPNLCWLWLFQSTPVSSERYCKMTSDLSWLHRSSIR